MNNVTMSFWNHVKDGEVDCVIGVMLVYDYYCVVTMNGKDGKRGGAELGKRGGAEFGRSNMVSFTMRFVITDCWAERDFCIISKSLACWFTKEKRDSILFIMESWWSLVNASCFSIAQDHVRIPSVINWKVVISMKAPFDAIPRLSGEEF